MSVTPIGRYANFDNAGQVKSHECPDNVRDNRKTSGVG
jgi:hypothetical protein